MTVIPPGVPESGPTQPAQYQVVSCLYRIVDNWYYATNEEHTYANAAAATASGKGRTYVARGVS